MRFVLPTLLSSIAVALTLVAVPPSVVVAGPAAAPVATPVVGCPSLANLRILLRQVANDRAAAAAVLSDDKADHLGCSVLGRDSVTALADHAALNGNAYDCVTVRTTSVCQWTIAGSVVPVEQARPGRRATDAGKPGKDKAAGEKVQR